MLRSSALAVLLTSALGSRIARKRTAASGTKFIAGVPVLNYHLAYGGKAALGQQEAEEEQEWVILVKPGTTDAQMRGICKLSRNGCNLEGHAEGGVPFVELRATEKDLEAVLSSAGGLVKFAEPDLQVSMIPELQADAPEAATWGLNKIGADKATGTGAGATVFVLDTGVRVTHQEFGGRGRPGLDMSTGGRICNGDLSCATDRQGHGTHCAGTAAGGSYGVAPKATVEAVKVLGDDGSGSWSWSYSALDYLATSSTRPAVASMSLGGRGTQQGMKDAVDAAVRAGVTVVVAAGNENSDACGFSPAFIPNAITVGSTTSTNGRSYFSNYGACVDIWAPGSDVLSAGISSDRSTATLSGTSMACPHVSGAAAILLSNNPRTDVLSDLLDTAAMNAISGLRSSDTNALLYVGAGGAPPSPPVAAPPPSNCPSWCSRGLCWLSTCRRECDFC